MAKQKRPKGTPKTHWCIPGNHSCYVTELAVVHHGTWGGVCYGCIKKRGDLKDYWRTHDAD